MPSDLVVGGGIAGLVAARRLALAGRRVTLLEATDRFGGQVGRLRLDGVDVDAGAESFATRGGTVARLLDELGLAGEVVAPNPVPAWLQPPTGPAVPLPATGVLGIPGEPFAPDVIRVIGRQAALRARLDVVLPAGIGADAATIGELVRLRMGRGVLERLVAPIVRGVYSREPDDLAIDAASPSLRAAVREHGSLAAAVRALRAASPAGSQVAGLRGGMFRIVDALVAECAKAGVDLVTGARVEDVESGSVRIDGVRQSGTVVLAAPDSRGSGAPTRRVTLVLLVVAGSPELDAAPRGTGVLVAQGRHGVRARALTHLTAKWPWLAEAFPGRHVLRLSYDGSPRAPLVLAERDAARLLGATIGRVIAANAIGWDRAGDSRSARPGDIPQVGETVAGTGLAAVVAQAESAAAALVGDSRGRARQGNMER